ncbi:helix-turn-helix domain-containing protein [Paenibacillus cellulositrophicus]|uniref:helix-turn-helix domain-containing protein n=1 Tax=Paenibacillus cellulositrophicus TaxID=562959 RepID=UPI003D97F15C
MGPSSLHRYFKQLTALSPLQYLKRIRLQEARRLLFSRIPRCREAAYRVGYESPTHFSRVFPQLFHSWFANSRTYTARWMDSSRRNGPHAPNKL